MARSVLECLIHPARNVAAGDALSIASSAFAGDKGVEVDVELVLAVDISYSMDRLEQELQRNGYVEAIKSEQFLNALKAGATGKVAISYMQWASYSDQDVLMNWAGLGIVINTKSGCFPGKDKSVFGNRTRNCK